MKTIIGSTIITKDKDIVCKELDGVTYLLNPHELTIHTLNDTASCIWKALAKKTTIDAIVRAVTVTFTVTEKIAKRDVMKFVEQYIAHGMIHIKSS